MQLLFSPILRVERPLVIGLLALLLTGCSSIDNWYESSYESTKGSLGDLVCFLPNSPVRKEDVVIKPVPSGGNWEKHFFETVEQGYLPIGKCEQTVFAYVRPHNFYTPWPLAVDQAVNVSADLVLIGRNETMTPETRVVSNTFGVSTGTSYGYATGNSYGTAVGGPYGAVGASRGNAMGWGNSTNFFSGNTTSYQQNLWVLEKRAVFFRKGNFGSFYGAILEIPPLLPDETENSPVVCVVFAVLKGSQAERDGIKRGQKVTKINGKTIKTRKDVSEFPDSLISSVEVEPLSEEAEAPSEEATPNAETETPSVEDKK